ncbi:MAG: hypothetical protein ACTHLE_04120 [Agriterribacter sp.]
MTVEQAIARLNAIIEALDAEFKRAAEESALSAIAMITNRIQQKGLPGKKYSKNKLPEFYFFDRELNAGGRELISKKQRKKQREALRKAGIKVRKNKVFDEDEQGISYEEWRIANGLQVDHVDLTFSGRMFQNLGLIGIRKVQNTWVAVAGGDQAETIAKLEWNTKRFGRFIRATDDEKRILQEQFTKRIEAFIQKLAA